MFLSFLNFLQTCFLCRLLTLPLWCPAGGLFCSPSAYPAFSLLFCPHPPAPPSRREGGDQGYFMQGASPLASPRLNPRALARPANPVPSGGVPSLSPAYPAFGLLSCPHPPAPLPRRRRGRPRLFHARGFAPCIPATEPARTGSTCQSSTQRGCAFLVACLPCLWFTFLPPSPRPPSPEEKGETKVISCKGLRPLHPRD